MKGKDIDPEKNSKKMIIKTGIKNKYLKKVFNFK